MYAGLFPAGGGFAELALASADRVAPMRGRASFAEAAGLVIGAGTAHEGLVDRGRLQPRETVLITAAAGGAGSAAVQIAVAVGARVVAVVGPLNHDYLLSLGASEVFDYHAAGHDAGDLIELMHAVWLTKKIIELVCSGTLAQATQDYTLELNRASKDLHPDGASHPSPALSVREQQLRAEFMEAARRNLVMQASPYCGGPTLKPEWRKAATWQLARAESP